MTKQEFLAKLDRLKLAAETLPEDADILQGEVRDYASGVARCDVSIELDNEVDGEHICDTTYGSAEWRGYMVSGCRVYGYREKDTTPDAANIQSGEMVADVVRPEE